MRNGHLVIASEATSLEPWIDSPRKRGKPRLRVACGATSRISVLIRLHNFDDPSVRVEEQKPTTCHDVMGSEMPRERRLLHNEHLLG